jgi:agmatinase
MARVKEHVSNVVAVGLRSVDQSEVANLDPDKTFYAHTLRHRPQWIQEAVDRLSGPVYVSIDVDVFDPAVLPATGTPEPGGLDWYTVLELLRAAAERRTVVGFDVVELCPMGHAPSEFIAAKLVYTFMGYLCAASRV